MPNKKVCVSASLALLLCSLFAASQLPAAPQSTGGSGYHLVKKVKLGGNGGWDYLEVDPATHRLFISRGTHYIVVDRTETKVAMQKLEKAVGKEWAKAKRRKARK